MAESETTQTAPEIEQGAYEIIRNRLLTQAKDLAARAQALNARRLEVFGGSEFALLGTERIRTENNCVPRDVVQVGGHLLFGYNVHLGLRTETRVEDVFALHRIVPTEGGLTFEEIRSGSERAFLEHEHFVRDFRELYLYYKSARLTRLRVVSGRLLAVFQVGAALGDIKAFRWAIGTDGSITYLDNRGDRDHTFPPSHDFEWTATTRENHVRGRHPHVSILDEVFVETVGGDLTVKVEDNTEDGLGIYREPVEDERQTLDDAEIHYAKVGSLILLKILPYRERQWRGLIFNTLTQKVVRVDAITHACVQLPEDHGVIFPGGYHLQTGETKLFDGNYAGLELQRVLRSPNGEDVLYAFHKPDEGRSMLLPYNLIRKEASSPMASHGFTSFDDGTLIILRAISDEPTRVHTLQVWRTPFFSEEHAADAPATGGYLEKVGNSDLVRGISDCFSLSRLIENQEPTRAIYEDLITGSIRVQDAYHWLGHDEAGNLVEVVKRIRDTAELIIDEFDKVEAIRKGTRDQLQAAENDLNDLVAGLHPEDWTSVPPFVDALAVLRRRRGHLVTLRDLRYVDRLRLGGIEARAIEAFESVSARAVTFLSSEEAFAPYHARIAEIEAESGAVGTVHDVAPLIRELDTLSENLDLLAEIVGALPIDDATLRTRILEGISEVLAGLNRGRALVASRRKELLSRESVAEFGVQFRLLGQAVTSTLAMADTPERCDNALSKLMVQIEELESRFGEMDEFLGQLATKREEVYEAASSKKQLLLDQRQRRADRLVEAADRILKNVTRRAAGHKDEEAFNAYFASDPMIAKLRDLVEDLRALGASVPADEIETRLKATRQDAARTLRDRADLFEGDAAIIRLGRHRFSVNTQPFDLTLVPRGDRPTLHVTGTDFHETLDDPELEKTRAFWSQDLVSETAEVYRGEYLAASILADAEEARGGQALESLHQAARTPDGLQALVREHAAQRYDEGYERGVHDVDAARILERLLALHATAGLLRFEPRARALAMIFWAHFSDDVVRSAWARRARSLSRLRVAFAHSEAIAAFAGELADRTGAFLSSHGIALESEEARIAGHYFFEELARDPLRFEVSAEAASLRDLFLQHLAVDGSGRELERDVEQLGSDLHSLYPLVSSWVRGYVQHAGRERAEIAALAPAIDGAVALLLVGDRVDHDVSSALPHATVEGLLGQHPRIQARALSLRLDEFMGRLARFRHVRVPAFRAYQRQRHDVLERERRRLRLSELEPRVMSAFVRNRLIDQVYLPLIGDNLAKQIGALGDARRTDLMGMLLLISPPGYGKTTLMEYVASRLGLIFVKINGPALGHSVTSLDPGEAPNATARQEIVKLNLAFEMASNVLLYVDDIQHTNPELLQKFISLCDAQRKVEGVWKGETRTYDLKGRRFMVCMAGNPYTESGERFRIPDMLANRSDIYNLGDILDGKDDLFALSYLENALTSNPVLAPLTTREPADILKIIGMARGDGTTPDQLVHAYSAPELEEILAVLRKLIRCQQVLLAVNQQYILSASQQDAFRTEPRFQLQGSYRNMNKLAEKIVAVMNEDELEALIDDHYLGEAQTLTTGAEHNLLKLAELRRTMTPEQQARWQQIKRSFARLQASGGDESDPVARVTGQLGLVSDRLADIGASIERSAKTGGADDSARLAAAVASSLQAVQSSLAGASAKGAGDAGEAVHAVAGRLDALNQHLAGIGQIIAATSSKPREHGISPKAVEGLATRLDGLNQRLAAIGATIAAAADARPAVPAPGPQIDKLQAAVAALAADGGTRREVVQTLPGGVQDLLNEMAHHVSDTLMPAVRAIARRVESSSDPRDRKVRDELTFALKQLDQLRDLADALRHLDTRGL